MKPLIATIIVLAAGPVFAQTQTQKRGQVLLLKSLRAFEGEIQREGANYRIKRGGGELLLPADNALMLCADWEQAFAFVSSRANLRDPDERIRLAKWCQANRLYQQALHEVETALAMRPNDPKAKHLRDVLKRQDQTKTQNPTPAPVKTVETTESAPFVDVDTPTLAVFSTRVQPILMNTCLRCHSHGEGGQFQLTRTTLGSRRSLTQRNLAAVLQYIDRADPERSLLLAKAVTAHGKSNRPPLKGRRAPAFLWLQHWTAMLLTNNPHLRKQKEEKTETVVKFRSVGSDGKVTPATQQTTQARPLPFQTSKQEPATPRKIDLNPALQSAKQLPARPVQHVPNLEKQPATKARPTVEQKPGAVVQASAKQPQATPTADPYDPAEFNRTLHPKE